MEVREGLWGWEETQWGVALAAGVRPSCGGACPSLLGDAKRHYGITLILCAPPLPPGLALGLQEEAWGTDVSGRVVNQLRGTRSARERGEPLSVARRLCAHLLDCHSQALCPSPWPSACPPLSRGPPPPCSTGAEHAIGSPKPGCFACCDHVTSGCVDVNISLSLLL